MTKHTLLAAWLLLGSYGCNPGEEVKTLEEPAVRPFELMGVVGNTYIGKCQSSEDKSTSSLEQVTFQENSWTHVSENFMGEGCDVQKKYVTYKSEYVNVEREESPDLVGWETVRYSYEALSATVHSKESADAFNKGTIYGYTDWIPNVEKDIAGRKFNEEHSAEAKKGDLRAATIKREDNRVTFALYKDNKAQADSPFVFTKNE